MARTELERTVQQSVIDRLTDTSPREPRDPLMSRDETERDYRISVQRDLEWLLNSRRTIVRIGPEHREVRKSVHEFGITDTTGLAVATPAGRAALTEEIRDAIARFEPRLMNVRVKMSDVNQVKSPQVRFTIQATLRMDPSPEQVVFDTVLEVASGTYAVEDGIADGAS
jgi:type VI secretion system protein ImpF